jgi:hypothetical protein
MTVKLEDLAPVYDADGAAVMPIMIHGHVLRPAIIDGKVQSGYYICSDGMPWSTKRARFKDLSVNYNLDYPMTGLWINDKTKSIEIHNLVCQTWHNKPYKPNCISDADWELTPESVRDLCDQLYEAHHIDHDTHNHSPDNLEWLTKKENREAWIAHRKKLQEEGDN